MKLHDYMLSLDREQRIDFAARCQSSVEYLMQIAYGYRTPKAQLAVSIERESAGAVPCEELLPDVDWKYLRGIRKAEA
jgi:DNA-binding transcriptional regulator YdaS (Cro superfamily)